MALTKISGDILKQPLNVGIITATSINVSGITTLGITSATNLTSQSLVVSGITTLGIATATNLTSQSLVVSGISTFTNGTILVGSGTSTGTVDQKLQVTGGAYVSGNLGIGTTNPQQKLDVNGTIRMSAVPGTNNNVYQAVLHQTASGDIDGGSSLTFNPGDDSLNINGMFINTNTVRANTNGPLFLTTANASSTIALYVGTTDIYSKGGFRPDVDNTYNLGSSTFRWANIYSAYLQVTGVSTFTNGPILVGSGTSTGTVDQKLQVTGGAYVSGNVGIGTNNPTYKLHVNGSFAATTKSFVIPHPTKPNYKLQHGSLEGPENGVYIRGRTTENIIELPEYWTGLVDEDTITVNLTPIGNKPIWIEEINNNKVYIDSNSDIDCFYTVFAERKDVEKLIVEIEEN